MWFYRPNLSTTSSETFVIRAPPHPWRTNQVSNRHLCGTKRGFIASEARLSTVIEQAASASGSRKLRVRATRKNISWPYCEWLSNDPMAALVPSMSDFIPSIGRSGKKERTHGLHRIGDPTYQCIRCIVWVHPWCGIAWLSRGAWRVPRYWRPSVVSAFLNSDTRVPLPWWRGSLSYLLSMRPFGAQAK